MSMGKETSKSGRTCSLGSKRCGEGPDRVGSFAVGALSEGVDASFFAGSSIGFDSAAGGTGLVAADGTGLVPAVGASAADADASHATPNHSRHVAVTDLARLSFRYIPTSLRVARHAEADVIASAVAIVTYCQA